MDIEHDTRDKKTGKMAPKNILFDSEAVHQTRVKHKASEELYSLLITGMDQSPLGDNIPVLMESKEQAEGGNTKTDPKIWNCIPSDEGLRTVNQPFCITSVKRN